MTYVVQYNQRYRPSCTGVAHLVVLLDKSTMTLQRSRRYLILFIFFFFQAEDGIRDYKVTGVQTCALPISERWYTSMKFRPTAWWRMRTSPGPGSPTATCTSSRTSGPPLWRICTAIPMGEIGRASCRGRG